MHSKTNGINLLSRNALIRFIAVTFVLGALTQLAAVHAGLKNGGHGWLMVTMWVPAVAAVTTSRAARALAWASLKRFKPRWVVLGFLVGVAPAVIKCGLLFVLGQSEWDTAHFELDGHSVKAVHDLGMVLGVGPQSIAWFALNLTLSIFLGSVVTALIGGVGEELGWRAVLQPALEQRFGAFKATLIVGLLWAYWHLPVNLNGYNDNVHPVLTSLVFFPLAVVAMSFGFAWLTKRSGSVWPAALAHGANNTIGAAFLLTAKSRSADTLAEVASMLIVAALVIGFGRAAPTTARHKPVDLPEAVQRGF